MAFVIKVSPCLLLLENRKIEPNKIPCCWIPFLLVSLARQLEILMTALLFFSIDQAKSSMQDESGFAALVDRVVTDATRW